MPNQITVDRVDSDGLWLKDRNGVQLAWGEMSDQDYRKVIASRPDTILRTPAFGLQNTRSPQAVEARAKLAKLEAKKRAGGALTPDEEGMVQDLMPFVNSDEE